MSGLLRAIHNMELDAAAQSMLADELSGFRQKLPPELLSGDEPYDPTDPRVLEEALEDIKQYLVVRLLSAGTED